MKLSKLLEDNNGSIRQTAKMLGRARATVRSWVKKDPDMTVEVMKQPKAVKSKCTALMLYDIHFPHEDWNHIETAIEYAKTHYNIDVLVLGGDGVDFHSISRWKKDPWEDMPFHEEIEYSENGISRIGEHFKEADKYFIKGNHEARLEAFLWTRAPEISKLKGMTVQEQLGLESSGFEWVDNLKRKEETGKFFMIGRLNILHGHELGICPSVNPARQYFLKSFDNVMVGHVHKVDDHYAKNLSDQVYGAFVVGPCCDMNPAYRPQNDWVAGFAVVEFGDDGYFKVNNYKVIDGRVL